MSTTQGRLRTDMVLADEVGVEIADAIYPDGWEFDRECPRCKEALTVTRTSDRITASERHSGKPHVCWDLPADANLVVMDDE